MKCAAAAALVALSGAAQAALIDRGNGLIYDTTRDITWLADMNYAVTSGYATQTPPPGVDPSGYMTWQAAKDWAAQLTYRGLSGWRLPTLNEQDSSCSAGSIAYPGYRFGVNCSGGELSGLFVTELGNVAGQGVSDPNGKTPTQIANYGLFINVQDSYYWSSTPDTFNPDSDRGDGFGYLYGTVDGNGNARGRALGFDTTLGYQDGTDILDSTYLAVAVRDGDVSVVPAPSTLALALLALGATVVARKRQSL